MNWLFSLLPWYGWAFLGIIAAVAVWRLLGTPAALALLAAAAGLVAYRKGADDQRATSAAELAKAQHQSSEMIHDEEQGARAAGDAARARAVGLRDRNAGSGQPKPG